MSTRFWCEGQAATLYVSIVNARWHFAANPTTEHHAAAEVAWKRTTSIHPGMGLKFTDVPEATARALKMLPREKP